jgi:GMP synthase-like glutamine amidotransferase
MRLLLLEHDPLEHSQSNLMLWARKNNHPVKVLEVFTGAPYPGQDDFDWLMVMGGSQHAWDEEDNPWLPSEKDFISQALASKKIVLGICFGAQLLAESMGGRVFPNSHQEIGWHEVSLTPEGRESFLFRSLPDPFLTFHWHSDHFSMPPGCRRLAFSEATENQAFIMPGRPVVGLQFHPEFSREIVTSYALSHGHEWKEGPYVAGKEKTLKQTERIQDTYWLMEALLDRMLRQFGSR